MLLRLALLISLATSAVLAAAIVKKSPSDVPPSWTQMGQSNAAAVYNFTIHLTGRDMAGLTTKMNQIVADGNGKWLSDTELANYASPPAAASQAITNFLKSSGIPSSAITTNKYGDQVTVKTTIGKTATLFKANMTDYNADGPIVSRTRAYTIPSSISAYVDDISPLALFGSIQSSGKLLDESKSSALMERHPSVHQKLSSRASADSTTVPTSCNVSAVTPQCRKDYYGTATYKRSTGAKQPDVAVIGFNNQYISNDLLTAFTKKYATNIPSNYTVPVSAFNGAAKTGKPGFEATLNMEAVVAEIYPLTTNYISMASVDNRADVWLLAFNTLIEQFTATTRPKVITISYSGNERYFTASQGKTMCDAAQKLTALGTTIVISTGDFGVGDGDNDQKCPPFVVRYPIGCQFVVAVGATEGFAPEQPMEPENGGLGTLSSSSGASNIFPIPAYQTDKVKAYQKTIGPLNGYYNMSGRMYPDLTAQGSKYSIIFNRDTVASGTSASAPYVAGLFGLVNDKRKAAKKGSIGWANPPLYNASLKDITVGGAYGCDDTKFGFPSKPGFDAASGNGSPMFAALSKAYGV